MFWKTWVNLQGTVKKCYTPRNLRLALDLFIFGGIYIYIVVLLHSEHVTTSVRKNSGSLSRKLEETHNQEKYSVCFASAWCQCHHLFIVNKYYVGIIEKQGAAEGHSYIDVGAMKKMAPRITPTWIMCHVDKILWDRQVYRSWTIHMDVGQNGRPMWDHRWKCLV